MRRVTSSITDAVPATAPAMMSLCPFRNFVALVMTMSAPCSSGRKFTGDAKVESTIRAMPWSCVTLAMAGTSITRSVGLVNASTKMARVLALTALRHARFMSGST